MKCLLLGATVMYEAAHRTGIEVGGDLSTDVAVQYCKQRDYYAVSLCSLKLCCRDYQWLVRPTSNKGKERCYRYSANQKLLL